VPVRKCRSETKVLKITVGQNSHPATITLEGKLSGPWVAELERSWSELTRNDGDSPAVVDLTDVTFISREGNRLLSSMYMQGAEFQAGPLMEMTLERIRKGT
jgi:anti-anti-sigma regulatory factor